MIKKMMRTLNLALKNSLTKRRLAVFLCSFTFSLSVRLACKYWEYKCFIENDILFTISSAITISGGIFINNLFDYIPLPNFNINFIYDIFNFFKHLFPSNILISLVKIKEIIKAYTMLFSTSGDGLGGPGGIGGPAGVGNVAGAGNPAGSGNVAGAGNPAGSGNVAGAGNVAGVGNVAGNRPLPWGSSDITTFVHIDDPHGIGARGYIPNGNNQPYGRRIAEALENHKNNSGANSSYHLPMMNRDAEIFFREWARHNKPNLYDNPAQQARVYPNTGDTIRKLKKC